MKFIKKDINRGLLIFVIILLVLLTSFTIYYQVTFNTLLNKYNKNQEVFGDLTANAIIEEFNKTSNFKENVQKYKEFLEKRYDELNSLNSNLKNEIEGLKSELALVKSQIEYQKAREIGPTEQFRLFQNKNDEISTLRKKISGLCSKLDVFNISSKECD